MSHDALERSLDALVEAFEGSKDRVALVGGFGLYLLQISREENRIPILVPALPPARTTRDLDVMLAAELVASPEDFARLREQLEATGFASQERNQFWQWCMGEGADAVVLDILAERIPELYRAKGKVRQGLEGAIFVDKRRARPKGQSSGLHARCTEEAIATFRGSSP